MKKLIDFFQNDIWKEDNNKYNSFFYRSLRIATSTFGGFISDDCFDKGSSLTFYSLMSLIPMLAIVFWIAQSFGVEQKISEEIRNQLQSQPEIASKLIQFSRSYLKEAKGSLIASLGILVLFWTTFSMIGNIASYFNKIWKIQKSRTLWQQFKSYTTFLFILPLFLVLSNSLIIYSTTLAVFASNFLNFSPLDFFIIKMIHYLITCCMLSFFYYYFPNTKVLLSSSIIAGTITSLIFFIWQWIYIEIQAHTTSYGAIYGSFAALPLFLFWLNYSWLIILFGTELSYEIQKDLKSQRG